jgi:hypothetical protein
MRWRGAGSEGEDEQDETEGATKCKILRMAIHESDSL